MDKRGRFEIREIKLQNFGRFTNKTIYIQSLHLHTRQMVVPLERQASTALMLSRMLCDLKPQFRA